jgi:mannose-6-phosphate isomerase-like protein (cupin superfamily)
MDEVNLLEKFGRFQEQYKPKIVGDLNDHQVKVVKFQGDFVWHHHENEDELFLVMKGRMTMGLRTGDVELSEGEMFIVPKGVEHRPTAKDECWICPHRTRHDVEHRQRSRRAHGGRSRSDLMASLSARLPENAPGDFYVDSTCIRLRHLPPHRARGLRAGRRALLRARATGRRRGRRRALMALVACPTASIGTVAKTDATPGVRAFPRGSRRTSPSADSRRRAPSGPWSYFVERPEGNVLVDSPRARGPAAEGAGGAGRGFHALPDAPRRRRGPRRVSEALRLRSA